MVMKRFTVVFGLVVLVGACNKPSEEDCHKAVTNVRKLLGTESVDADINGDVRRCKGGSSKKAVECAINATSVEQLRACGFLKVSAPPAPAAPAAGSGSGSGSAK
jgi:hypothetical protein